MKRYQTLLSLFLIIALTYYSFYTLMPQNGKTASIPDTEFSSERALIPLKEISKAPHYVGTKEHERVRKFLINQLEGLGLETTTQEGFVLNTKWKSLDRSKNIIAKINGTSHEKALLLLSHYDSALTPSYGASDAGSGVVTILESVRAYLASGKTPKNDIIILFSDAEELGLDGARLFVNEHPWAKDVGLVLNFEARGSGGPSNMIVETNGGNKNLIKAFIDADLEYPVASSLMYSVYKLLPNDTDSTVFREDGDIDSFFFAFIDDHYDYHTANDTFENLDRNTLQHQGAYLLPLIHYFSEIDLSTLKADSDDVYVNVPFLKMIRYPFTWVMPMLIIAIVLFIALIFFGFYKRELTGKSILKGFVPFIIALLLCGFIGYYGWKLLIVLYPHYSEIQHGFTYNGHTYIAFFVLLSLGLVFGIYNRFLNKQNRASLFIAPLAFWIVINVLVSIYLLGGAFFIIPVYFGLLSLYILIQFKKPNLLLLVILGAPSLFLIAPLIQFFPIGLGLKMLAISCVFSVLLFGLFIPVFGFYKVKGTLSYIFYLLAIGFFISAHFSSSFSSERQKPNSLIYYQDIDKEESFWVTYDNILDDWTKGYLGESPMLASSVIESASGSKYSSAYSYAAEAPNKLIPPFEVELNKDTLIEANREVAFTIIPKRPVNQISLYTSNEVSFNFLSFNGKKMPFENNSQKIKSNELVRHFVSDNDSLNVVFSISKETPINFTVLEYSYDLMNHPQFSIDKRSDDMMPKPFIITDAVVVKKLIDIDSLGIIKKDSIN